jgi:hypothetical protein
MPRAGSRRNCIAISVTCSTARRMTAALEALVKTLPEPPAT